MKRNGINGIINGVCNPFCLAPGMFLNRTETFLMLISNTDPNRVSSDSQLLYLLLVKLTFKSAELKV